MTTVELPYDQHEGLITVSEAATLAGINATTIRQWKRRGHLLAAALEEFGRPLFTGIAVLRAEAKTRRGARRQPVPAV
jgi:hypothetical protein